MTPSLPQATGVLFRTHLARMVFSKRGFVSLLLVLLPVAAALLIERISEVDGPPPEGMVPMFGWMLLVQTIVPLVALIFGSAVVAEEVDDRTITFLFTRPIPRQSILLGRWLAAASIVTVLLAASAALTMGILSRVAEFDPEEVPLPDGLLWRLGIGAVVGGVVYSAMFAALGTLMKRPVLVGLAYTFVVEGFLGNLPGATRGITVQHYLKSYVWADASELARRMPFFISEADLATPTEALVTLALILVGAIALGAWLIARRQFVLPS